jgi:DNA-binding NarL/FixJ family response regulator
VQGAVGGPAPADLRAARFTIAGKEMAVLSHPLPAADLPKNLTDAEREVALGIFAGLSNAEIAVARGTSPRTVANQVASLFTKLGLRSRSELARLAYAPDARHSGGATTGRGRSGDPSRR